MRDVRIGLCGFTIAFSDYVQKFPLVEVQQTFYQPPDPATMRRWRAQAPVRFEFTLKAWQLITHDASLSTYRRLRRPLTRTERSEAGSFRDTAIVQEGWKTTLACADLLRATAILFQCPASFRATDENVANLRAFMRRVERRPGVRFLWEPRGPWPDDLVATLCRELDLTHVVDPFERATMTPEAIYYRLHGITGSRHVYSDEELAKLAAMLRPAGRQYVLFNNIPRAGDAERFKRLL